jgi:hypothetical protein
MAGRRGDDEIWICRASLVSPTGWFLISMLSIVAPAAGEGLADRLARSVDAGLDLRYRYEGVEEEGKPSAADANTLKLRINLASVDIHGFSGLLELDHVEGLGVPHYDDTRNGRTSYPVVADPEGTDLNQAWMQYAFGPGARVRLGRQRINHGNQRFVGASDWRQNEQTFDALRIDWTAPVGMAIDYAYVGQVRRVFGPDPGMPPAMLNGDSHLLSLRLTSLPASTVQVYAYVLGFNDFPRLSSETFGLRYEGRRAVSEAWTMNWALEYALQQDAAGNPVHVDAGYGLAELRFTVAETQFVAGREILSGERGVDDPSANPSFQTPLATLHKWQGWADKFTTTPPAGIKDTYAGIGAQRRGWSAHALWHEFTAAAGESHYGSELDLSVAGKLTKQLEVLLKLADYRANDAYMNTRKIWIQLRAAF